MFPGGSDVKESACNAGDPGSIPGLGRYFGEGNGNPFQYPCLEHSMDRGACGLYMGLQRVRHDTTEQLTHTPSASPEVITIWSISRYCQLSLGEKWSRSSPDDSPVKNNWARPLVRLNMSTVLCCSYTSCAVTVPWCTVLVDFNNAWIAYYRFW